MDTKTFAGKFLSRLDRIDRRQIEAYLLRLIHAREFLELVFNRMEEGIIVTDTNLRILFMNSPSCRHLGLKGEPNSFAGKSLMSLVKNEQLLELMESFDPSSSESVSEEVVLKKPSQKILKFSILPIHEEVGSQESVVFLINDLTEIKKAEHLKMQRQHIAALASLTAGVAHEVKNPLNSLQIHAQLLEKYLNQEPEETAEKDRKRARRSIDVMLEEISRLSEIVNNFMMAVRPKQVHLEPSSINKVLKRVIEVVYPVLEEKGIDFKYHPEPAQAKVKINEKRLYQAFLNIINNAVEAMENTENPKLEIVSHIQTGYMAIDFIDNGCGIPEDKRDKIFEPYYTTKFNGSGRGLMMVYRIVNEHGGAIDIKSREGKGTKFTVLLPLFSRPVRLLTEAKENSIDIQEQE